MKLSATFLSLVLLLFISACKKKKELKNYAPNLPGEYSWINSIQFNHYTNSPEMDKINYGVRIKSNCKFELFENNTLILSSKFKAIEQVSKNKFCISIYKKHADKDDEPLVFYFENEILSSSNFPFNNRTNNFIRIK